MAYTDIDKPTDYFNTKLYTGNGSTQSITGVGFQPDWVYFKQRTGTPSSSGSQVYDVVRSATKYLSTHSTNAEATQSNGLTSFDSDGFSIGNTSRINGNTESYVAWNWLAGGTASSNTDGSITSNVSANTTSGFSIVSWTGNGTNPSTIGHGLNQTPDVILLKNRETSATNWIMYHSANTSAPETDYLILDSTNATADSANVWSDTAPTSSVFTVGSAGSVNNNGDDFITYCFHSVKGFSKMGSYTGNGNADGTFVYTGFKPAMIIRKISSTTGGWLIHDNTRTPFNGLNSNTNGLRPNSSEAEFDFFDIDYLSNGFKIRTAEANHNQSGQTYIYMAFAESPFVTSTGIPTTAR